MRIALVTPAPPGSRHGNRTTALRWARILRALGHRVRLGEAWTGGDHDLLVALHARKSASSVARFRRRHPGRPIVVALTGTDVYHDLARSPAARRTVAAADRLVVLQDLARRELAPQHRARTRTICQSVARLPAPAAPVTRDFEVCVLAHLRPVKDPFRAARAARLLPARSHLRVIHLGAAHSPGMAARARAEERACPRYRWLGDLPRGRALRRLARARLLVVSSRLEGGANVVSEAIALAVPVLASRVPGNVGLLGASYPGYFAVGSTVELARLLARAEADPVWLRGLARAVKRRRALVAPAREIAAWRALVAELGERRAVNHADAGAGRKR